MTKEEQQLYNELKKEIKRANQRILRLERETGLEQPFATKQLYDYIDNFAITKKGRVGLSSKWDLTQLKVVQKAVKDFLANNDFSTVRGVKKYKKELETELNDTVNYKQANTMYEAKKHWDWILDYIPRSEFFGYFVWPARRNNWTREKWIKNLNDALVHNKVNIADEDLRDDLIDLYNYFVRDYTG